MSLNWTLVLYGVLILIIVTTQYVVFKDYSEYISASLSEDKKIINNRTQELVEVVEHDAPMSLQLEYLYQQAHALRYEMEIQYLNTGESRENFTLISRRLTSIIDALQKAEEKHIDKFDEFIDAITILADIAADAGNEEEYDDFSQLYYDSGAVTNRIIRVINRSRKSIQAHNKALSVRFAEETLSYQKNILVRSKREAQYRQFYSGLMIFMIVVPLAAMIFLFKQLYSRLRMIENYAADIAHEKYALPPFYSSDPTGKLALMLCLVGRKMRESLRLSREHIKQTETALGKAEKLASYDPLTGLVNRRYFNKFLGTVIESAKQDSYLLFLDLDNFKDVNDILGHDVGDALLIEISNKLQHAVRPNDVVCRMGGDEFAIYINASRDNIEQVVTRILESVREPLDIGDEIIHASMSIGVVNVKSGSNTENLMKQADIAMYHAKQSGRNRFKFFTHELEELIQTRQGIIHELREALANMEFELFYQPKVSLGSNRMNGYEALIRWRHPLKGLVPPDSFIPIAEESEMIHPLGIWILEQACKDSLLLQSSGIFIPVSVNVSPRQFYAPNFVRMIQTVIEMTGMPAHLLELEVTETILMDKLEVAIEMLTQLRAMGLRISIDDFGTGYSSMKYLRDLPVDVMKIDKSFVDNICLKKKDREITSTMSDLGKRLGLEVIAEGVETIEQMNVLKTMGCDTGQGYLFSKPLPFGEFKAYVENTEPLMRSCNIALQNNA